MVLIEIKQPRSTLRARRLRPCTLRIPALLKLNVIGIISPSGAVLLDVRSDADTKRNADHECQEWHKYINEDGFGLRIYFVLGQRSIRSG